MNGWPQDAFARLLRSRQNPSPSRRILSGIALLISPKPEMEKKIIVKPDFSTTC